MTISYHAEKALNSIFSLKSQGFVRSLNVQYLQKSDWVKYPVPLIHDCLTTPRSPVATHLGQTIYMF